MAPRETRSAAAAKVSKPPVKTPRKPKNSAAAKVTLSTADVEPSGPTTSMSYLERVKLMKGAIRAQFPNASEKELDVSARKAVTDMNKRMKSDKERLDGIQGASKAMMEEEDGNEEQVDELQATETGSDMGSVVEQAGPVTPTKGKGKNTKTTGATTPIKNAPKRKVTIISDEEASDAEDKPEKKKAKTQSPRKSAAARSSKSAGEKSGAGGKRTVAEVVIPSPPRKTVSKASKDEERLTALLGRKGAKGAKKGKPSLVVPESNSDESENDERMETEDDEMGGDALPTGHKAHSIDDESDEEERSYKMSAGDDDDDEESEEDSWVKDEADPDEIIVKTEEKPARVPKGKGKSKTAKGKGKGKSKGHKKSKPDEEDILAQEPWKTLVVRAQQDLRAYLALENAWPRKRGTDVEKKSVPKRIMQDIAKHHPSYARNAEFQEDFNNNFEFHWEALARQVIKGASQLRQEVKQKAKRVVEKEFMSIKLSEVDANGAPLSALARAQKLQSAKEARIKWLKTDDAFHYGSLVLPDANVDPELDTPFHNMAIAEVIALQWWSGPHPEAFRGRNKERFEEALKRIPSNMIALVCSALRVALDEALKGNATVNFDEKTYAPEHDQYKESVDVVRELGNPENVSSEAGFIRLAKSMDTNLSTNIRAMAGIPEGVEGVDGGTGKGKRPPGINFAKVRGKWGKPEDASSAAASSSKAADAGGSKAPLSKGPEAGTSQGGSSQPVMPDAASGSKGEEEERD
ncbi:uncharacterized protein B0H18DRAFT_1122641 [Fomitopsis serialis]|uniref:uncharacterized protein n=1 Tax=Fomitopsis serialis TaxID=139415 RepID=UPI0020078990|nr:uncharacterized protein B0H18DRAFT_1122641 [Neoantrodia serialis]KAH9919277.1 hypothetical protein B0H18DRAFT_1122641 [Neoantrodia serialis]